jgi:hypothetical protein
VRDNLTRGTYIMVARSRMHCALLLILSIPALAQEPAAKGEEAPDPGKYERCAALSAPDADLGKVLQAGCCTSSALMEPFDTISKRHFSARYFSSLAC